MDSPTPEEARGGFCIYSGIQYYLMAQTFTIRSLRREGESKERN